MKKTLLAMAVLLGALASSPATIFQFDLVGTAGSGLLAANEPSLAVPSTASGGEINGGTNGFGLYYNDVSMQLFINVGWGSSQGFNDLTTTSTAAHIHGPTTLNNGNGFTQTAGVLFNLSRSSTAASGGVFTTTAVTLTGPQQTDLFNGKYYINIHTGNNTGGELRGFLVAVPEPSTYALGGLGLLGLLTLRMRRKA